MSTTLRRCRLRRLALSVASALFGCSTAATAAERLQAIDVIGVTPLHGVGVSADRFPSNTQSLGDDEIHDGGASVAETMNRRLNSVTLNAAQNNPLQPDVQYRGFTASPLLGLPQGLAVYTDGVRQNTAFGDTVHWDMLPQIAIDSLNLMPGSNPLFGLNALGGALSLQTKSGFTFDGTRATALGGSWGRIEANAETGGQQGSFAYYLAVSHFEEDGWRDHSPSDADSAFGKLSWQSDVSQLDLSVSGGNSRLIGNGPAPERLLARDREAIYTRPDRTENNQLALTLTGNTELNDDVLLSGNMYWRRHDIKTLNGDDSDIEECTAPVGFLCIEDDGMEEQVEDANGNPVAASAALEGATVNTSKTDQDMYGGSLQADYFNELFGRENQFIAGVSWDEGHTRYKSKTELGALDSSRKAVGGGVIDGDSFVDVDTRTRTYSLYFFDTLAVTERLDVNVAGRWNHTNIRLDDQIGTALDGDHTFKRFNPSLGASYGFDEGTTVYGSYSESTRAPTAVELTCADPDDPCRLPNAFLSDPPLDQVVAKTFEVGARGSLGAVGWQVGLFTTTNEDDIIFVSSGALTSEGYFDNIGDTRRRGIEVSLRGTAVSQKLDWFVAYTYLDATFQDSFAAPSANNPAAVGGEIQVGSGDRIPGLPEHAIKVGADYRITPALTLGADMLYNSDQYVRGDESNQLDPIDGYAVFNLRAQYDVNEHVRLIAKVDNVFDKDYESFGALGEPDEVLGPAYDSPRFLGPGAPRGGWIGIEATF